MEDPILPCKFRDSRDNCSHDKDFEVDRPLPAVVTLHMIVQRCSAILAAECLMSVKK